MIIYKEKVEEKGVPFYASVDITHFSFDGHNDLCVWFVPSDCKVQYMVVGTGWEFDDCWVPMKMMSISHGGFVWHLLKHR